MKKLVLISALILWSCTSTRVRRQIDPVQTATLKQTYRLKDIISEQSYGLNRENEFVKLSFDKLNDQFQLMCGPAHASCSFLNQPSVAQKTLPSTNRPALKRELAPEVFNVLQKRPIREQISFFSRFSLPELNSSLMQLQLTSVCYDANFYLAYTATLEDSFPNLSAFDTTLKIHEKALQCHPGETTFRSAQRLGFQYLQVSRTHDAKNIFLKAMRATSSNYEKKRMAYWAEQTGHRLAQNEALKPLPPLHPYFFRIITPNATSKLDLFSESQDIAIHMRSPTQHALNMYLRMAERHLLDGRIDGANELLKRINLDSVKNENDTFKLYLSYLFFQGRHALATFRLLSELTAKDTSMYTLETMELLYPRWYEKEIREAATEYGIDPLLVLALIRQESAFDPKARSSANAMGLMQLIPSTARLYGVKSPRLLYDPKTNIQAGVKYLSQLMKIFNGDVDLVLAAYNAGPQKISGWRKRYITDQRDLFIELIPYKETRDYVLSTRRNLAWYKILLDSDGPNNPLATSYPTEEAATFSDPVQAL